MIDQRFERRTYCGADFALYCDLDGVFADYATGIERLGFKIDRSLRSELNRSGTGHPLKRKMHEAIQGTNFYYQLPIMPDAAEFYRDFAVVEPVILTASPKFGATEDDYFFNPHWLGALYHKRRWMEEVFLPEALWYEGIGHGRMLVKRHPARAALPDERYICTISARKQDFIQRKPHEKQVLVDDRPVNCQNWTNAGGFAICHNGDFTRTRALLATFLSS